jgi:tRNA-specific 2-thiouridylase
VIVGEAEDLVVGEFEVDHFSWHHPECGEGSFDCTVKIRYAHPGASATVTPTGDGRAIVRMPVPQRAVTPGQAAVFYRDDEVLGGGWIARNRVVFTPDGTREVGAGL